MVSMDAVASGMDGRLGSDTSIALLVASSTARLDTSQRERERLCRGKDGNRSFRALQEGEQKVRRVARVASPSSSLKGEGLVTGGVSL